MKVTDEIDMMFRGIADESYRTVEIENMLARRGYRELGFGSSRTVYTFGRYVIKIAMDGKGIAQNKAEISLFSENCPFYNRIVRYSPKGHWIVARRARRVTEKFIRKKYGVSKDMFNRALSRTLYGPRVWKSGVDNLKRWEDASKRERVLFEKLSKRKFFADAREFARHKEYLNNDVDHINDSYGVVDDRIVLIDGGLTRKIIKEWY